VNTAAGGPVNTAAGGPVNRTEGDPVNTAGGDPVTRWVVVGASGFVGSAVHAALRERGADVVPMRAPRLTADPDASAADLAAAAAGHPAVDTLAEALAGADVVVNAAGAATPDAAASPELTGADALLPAVLAVACARAGVGRFVHLSSAAVQGRRAVLDESPDVAPFSPYSAAKAAGERAVALVAGRPGSVVTLRATSVHGPGRPTTAALARFASSRAASVAGRGDRPTTVCHVADLAALVVFVGGFAGGPDAPPPIVLQPWTGLTTAGVLRALSGGREPRHIPVPVARTLLALGRVAAAVLKPLAGPVRRVEVLWFGQPQVDAWAAGAGFRPTGTELRPGPWT
jgi:dTDP-4-dehydrorhamnose reductase